MDMTRRVKNVAEKTLTRMGFEVVQCLVFGRVHMTLQVMIDRLDLTPVGIDDCVLVNKGLSAIFAAEDVPLSRYILEVTSPGAERPLVQEKHFQRFVGHPIRLQIYESKGGRRKFSGILTTADETSISVLCGKPPEQLSESFLYTEVYKAFLNPFDQKDQKVPRKMKGKG